MHLSDNIFSQSITLTPTQSKVYEKNKLSNNSTSQFSPKTMAS